MTGPRKAKKTKPAKSRTPKAVKPTFESAYGSDRRLSAHQKLAELACERMAAREKRKLPLLFWKMDEWEERFLHQVRHAHSLLKIYPVELILRALAKCPGIYSLGAPMLWAEISDLHHRKDRDGQEPPAPTDMVDIPDTEGKPRGVSMDKSLRSKLD